VVRKNSLSIVGRPCSPDHIYDATRKDWTRHSPIFRVTIDRFIGIISSWLKKSHPKSDLRSRSMKRLTTELTPKPVQILDCLTLCVQEQCSPPTFQELAHGLNLTEKHTRDGVHILEPEGLFTPAAIVDLRLSLRKPLPTALFHDLPPVGRVMAGKPVEVFGPHQRLPIPPWLLRSGARDVTAVRGRSGHPAAIGPPNRGDAGVVVHGETTTTRSYRCGALLAWRHAMGHMTPRFPAARYGKVCQASRGMKGR
jgi:hypothetical protein